MRIIAGVLCDYAEVREGLLTVVSAGITRLWRGEFPAEMGVFLALQVEVEPAARPFRHEFGVRITGPSQKEVGTIAGGFQVGADGDFEADEPAIVNVPLDLRPVVIEEVGWYNLSISIDGADAYVLRVRVGQPPASEADPGIRTAPGGSRTH
jgi:hypothetical protein